MNLQQDGTYCKVSKIIYDSVIQAITDSQYLQSKSNYIAMGTSMQIPSSEQAKQSYRNHAIPRKNIPREKQKFYRNSDRVAPKARSGHKRQIFENEKERVPEKKTVVKVSKQIDLYEFTQLPSEIPSIEQHFDNYKDSYRQISMKPKVELLKKPIKREEENEYLTYQRSSNGTIELRKTQQNLVGIIKEQNSGKIQQASIDNRVPHCEQACSDKILSDIIHTIEVRKQVEEKLPKRSSNQLFSFQKYRSKTCVGQRSSIDFKPCEKVKIQQLSSQHMEILKTYQLLKTNEISSPLAKLEQQQLNSKPCIKPAQTPSSPRGKLRFQKIKNKNQQVINQYYQNSNNDNSSKPGLSSLSWKRSTRASSDYQWRPRYLLTL